MISLQILLNLNYFFHLEGFNIQKVNFFTSVSHEEEHFICLFIEVLRQSPPFLNFFRKIDGFYQFQIIIENQCFFALPRKVVYKSFALLCFRIYYIYEFAAFSEVLAAYRGFFQSFHCFSVDQVNEALSIHSCTLQNCCWIEKSKSLGKLVHILFVYFLYSIIVIGIRLFQLIHFAITLLNISFFRFLVQKMKRSEWKGDSQHRND